MSNAIRRGAFNSVVRVPSAATPKLRCILQAIGDDIDRNGYLDFSKLTLTHFARWVILSLDGVDYLVLETNFDPPLIAHVEELVATGVPTLAAIYGQCGFTGGANIRALAAFILDHSVPCNAFYRAYPHSAQRIRTDMMLRDLAMAERRTHSATIANPAAFCSGLRATLLGAGVDLRPDPPPIPTTADRLATRIIEPGSVHAATTIALGAMFLALAPVFLAVERMESDGGYRKTHDRVPPNLREDVQGQNQLSHVVAVKWNPVRRRFLRIVLRGIDSLSEHYFTRGELGSITAIHFARWLIVDDKWLVFFANYDGSWEHYLGDFIDLEARALTAVWGNTQGFPSTRLFIGRGATDEEGFKQWARDYQVPSQVWYSAYKTLSVQNVWSNARLRNELKPVMTQADARGWLELL